MGTQFNAGGTPCNWEFFDASFYSGASATFDICVTNQFSGNGLFGNDFAMDDMMLQGVCTVTDEVQVNISSPQAIINNIPTLDCNATDICMTLDGSTSTPVGNVTYQWTATNGGVIQSDANIAIPTICAEGDYTLVVSEGTGTEICDSPPVMLSVSDNNANPPNSMLSGPPDGCDGTMLVFTINDDPAFTNINWIESPGMTIVSGQSTTSISALFSNTTMANVCVEVMNNCNLTDQQCTPVNINQAPVDSAPNGPFSICESAMPIYNLNNFDPNINYNWSTVGGGIITFGQGTGTVGVDWTGAINPQICVEGSNDCGTSNNVCMNVDLLTSITTNYTWTTLDPDEVGTTTETFTSINGCDSTAINTTILIVNTCSIFADAGPDVTICPNGGPVNLNGLVSGDNIIGGVWSPSTGLADPNSASTTATVSTTTTYTFTGQSLSTANLIQNPSFSNGNNGFTSDYGFENCGSHPLGLLGCEGAYTITTNASTTHVDFSACAGVDSPEFMAINGQVSFAQVWCQDIVVNPNTVYQFSAFATSIHPSNPAELQFSINGSTIGNLFNVSSATCAVSYTHLTLPTKA